MSIKSFGQVSQTFSSDNFKVMCPCELYTNEVFIDMYKKQGGDNLVSAYVCAKNEDNYYTGEIYTINIYDLKSIYEIALPPDYSYLESLYLESYVTELLNAGFLYKEIIFNGVKAIEYELVQYGMPAKAIFFIKNKQSYYLQVSTRNNLTTRFNNFKLSLEFL